MDAVLLVYCVWYGCCCVCRFVAVFYQINVEQCVLFVSALILLIMCSIRMRCCYCCWCLNCHCGCCHCGCFCCHGKVKLFVDVVTVLYSHIYLASLYRSLFTLFSKRLHIDPSISDQHETYPSCFMSSKIFGWMLRSTIGHPRKGSAHFCRLEQSFFTFWPCSGLREA